MIDTTTNTIIATIPLAGIEPHKLAVNPAGTRLYVPMKSNTVEVFDTATNLPVAIIPVPGGAQAVAFTPAGGRAFVPNGITKSRYSTPPQTASWEQSRLASIPSMWRLPPLRRASTTTTTDTAHRATYLANNGVAEDCNDDDPDVNPAAFEIPGNLVDENCDGALGPCCPFLAWRNHGQ